MENLQPKLRFPEFIGKWTIKLLEDISERGSGHTPNKKESRYYNGNIKWVSLADSKFLDNGYLENTTNFISNEGIKNSSAVLHPAGSVLLSRDAGVGKSAIMKTEMAVSQHFIVWRPFSNELNNWFLYYILQILKPEFERVAIGSTIKTIGLPYFKKLKILIPPLSEQTKIASFLSAIDEKLNLLKDKKTAIEEYKKGMMQKIFSQELRFKDENGKDFGNWSQVTLKEVFDYKKGSGISKDKLDPEGIFKCVLYGELYTKYNEVIFNVISKTNSNEGLKSIKGDLLIPSSTTTSGIDLANVTALNFDNVLLGGDITVLRSNQKVSSVFYAYYLSNHKKEEIASYAQGITIVHLYYNHIKEMIIDFPCFEEQTKIATFLSAIDEKIELVSQQIEDTQEYKKGLLQQLFC
jgi:type I restriction enzyme, S subunit